MRSPGLVEEGERGRRKVRTEQNEGSLKRRAIQLLSLERRSLGRWSLLRSRASSARSRC